MMHGIWHSTRREHHVPVHVNGHVYVPMGTRVLELILEFTSESGTLQ